MDEFRGAYQAWMDVPFPIGDAEDELGELHADVALADIWVAESVIPYVKRGAFVPAAVDVLGALSALRVRAAALGDVGQAAEYLHYIDLLTDLYQAFLQDGGHTATA